MNKISTKFIILGMLGVLLTACGGPVRESAPAPVEHRGSSPVPSSASSSEPQISAYRPPKQHLAIARPQPAKAVQILIRRADDQRHAGDYASAAVSLERGLRIEPRNAKLWNRLAHVRAAQRRYGQVSQFAAKSNAFVASDDALQADNWTLIAQARLAQGDKRGAAKARERARLLR